MSAEEVRALFEKWLADTYDSDAEWDAARNCYKEPSVHLAWQAWRAASPPSEQNAKSDK